MDDFCPSLAIQVSPHPTPAEIIIITVGKRNGIFQVSLGNGEGMFKVWYILFSCSKMVRTPMPKLFPFLIKKTNYNNNISL